MSIPQDHLRPIVFYEWGRGTKAMSTTVKWWTACFKGGNTDFESKSLSGRPHTGEDSPFSTLPKRIWMLAPTIL
ncbi:hypothetical protein OESDEN_00055 [Oesophagostomum dentatum]|uniref:Mos1 transposase HTH domain-containing protein n=1 Tax=Oesophagostomum dentatum TaxID=61180 RepID=A0A0B1TVR2_OESDE|nr:hypothetical protein OESDEN_00055 [Oesophagostomum dentatum]